MRLTFETRRAIAQALAKRCNAAPTSCPVDGVCPFGMDCSEVKPWQWEKALGSVQCKKVKHSKERPTMCKKSIDHWEAMKQDFAEYPDKAVEYVRELVRQANELEDRVQELEAENAAIKRELAGEMEKY